MNEINMAMSVATENIAVAITLQNKKKKDIAKKCGISSTSLTTIVGDTEGKKNTTAKNLLAIWVIGLGRPAEKLFEKGGYQNEKV